MPIWCNFFISILIMFLGILSFFYIFNWLFVDSPSNTCYDGDERVDLLAGCSKCLCEWVVLNDFVVLVGDVWESIMTISGFNELYDVWWGWC